MKEIKEYLILENVRLSYANVLKAVKFKGEEDEKFSARLIIEGANASTLKRFNDYYEDFVNNPESWGKANNGKLPTKIIESPLIVGDEKVEAEAGSMYVNAKSNFAPSIVDMEAEPITDIKSGDYANVMIRLYAYQYGGKFGIGVQLGHIQKVADGEALSTLLSATDVFGKN